MRPGDIDRRVAQLAEAQFGVFTTAQARRLGLTASVIRTRLRSGAWSWLARGVLRIEGTPRSFLQLTKAATLLTAGSVASGRAAARLHGFGEIRCTSPEITVTSGRSHANPLAVVRRRRSVRSTRVLGIPVTTIDQTIADLAGSVPFAVLEQCTDDLLLAGRCPLARLEDRLVEASAQRARGVVDLRRLVDARSEGSPVAQSELERHLHRLLATPGIPPHVRQLPLPWLGPGAGVADAFLPAWTLIVEADGRRWHARVEAFRSDRERSNLALAHGLGTLRFTWVDLTEDADASLALLLQVGRARSSVAPP